MSVVNLYIAQNREASHTALSVCNYSQITAFKVVSYTCYNSVLDHGNVPVKSYTKSDRRSSARAVSGSFQIQSYYFLARDQKAVDTKHLS